MPKTYDLTRFTKKQLQVIAAEAGLRKNWAPISIAEIRGMLSYVDFARMRLALERAGVENADIEDLTIELGEPGEDDREYGGEDPPERASETQREMTHTATNMVEVVTPVKATPKIASGNVSDVAAALAGLLASGATNEARVAEIVESRITVAEKWASREFDRLLTRLEDMKENQPTLTIVQPTIGAPKKIEGLTHARFERVYKLASLRQNILLVGPAGCGKTQLAEQVASALELPFAFLSCSAGMSESQLQGWLLPVGTDGAFSYVPAGFVNAYENGGVFLLDEIDAADENLLLVINAALANGNFAIAQRYNNPVAKRHADFVMIAAANTFGHGADRVYAGRNQLDGATLDRFRTGLTTMDYDANVEGQLVDPAVLRWGANIRARINANKLRRVMSTRVLLGYTHQKLAGFSMAEWEDSYFADWSRDELSKVGR